MARCPSCGQDNTYGCACERGADQIAEAQREGALRIAGAIRAGAERVADEQRALADEMAAQRKQDEERVQAANRPELHRAVQFGDAPRVRELLDAGANPNRQDDFGCFPLHLAVLAGETEIARLLLARRADPNALTVTSGNGSSPLYVAIEAGNLAIVQVLTNAGASVNSVCHHNKRRTEASPLHYAVRSGNLAVVQALLSAGADVNFPDRDGRGPLSWADELQEPSPVVLALIGRGASVNRQDDQGRTALHGAAYNANMAMVGLLLDAGAEIDAVDKRGKRPIEPARMGRTKDNRTVSRELERFLLARGAAPVPPSPPRSAPSKRKAQAAGGCCLACISVFGTVIAAAHLLVR